MARLEGPADAPLARVFDAARPTASASASTARARRSASACWAPAPRRPTARFFAARIAEALALRQAVLPPETTGYRLLNAEGDGVPGWTVDRFGDVLVSQITAAGLEALRGEAYAALAGPSRARDRAGERRAGAAGRGALPRGTK